MMKSGKVFSRAVLLVFLMVMGVWACAGKPFNPPQADEIPKGPGVFTKGDDGAVLYDSNKERLPDDASTPQTPAASPDGIQQPAAEVDYDEYESYRQWKLWKKSAVGTPEYEEFQQWREWRDYQKWKNQE
ncbi:MAG: hypothetical protein JRE21_06115 [Deltaproteobacteria bacterium]|jgi:hypothetical protein|nr:hypothetical protein [Deltaproteobacteria bacterium]